MGFCIGTFLGLFLVHAEIRGSGGFPSVEAFVSLLACVGFRMVRFLAH